MDKEKMVAASLTTDMMAEGKRLLEHLDSTSNEVDAALWFFFPDIEKWRLIISLPKLAPKGPKASYRAIQQAIKKLKSSKLGLDEIAIPRPNAPLLDLLRKVFRTGPGISGIRITNSVVNGQLIDDVFIYRLQ